MPSSFSPQDFCDKWRQADLKERSAAQEHFPTNLYNARPTWLGLAHQKLDRAVLAAYGWPADLSDDQILERLLVLNLERAVVDE